MRYTCIILAAEIIEVVDARRHVRAELRLDLSGADDVQSAVGGEGRKPLEVLALQRPCAWAEDDSLVLSIGTLGDPLAALAIIEPKDG